MTRHTTSGQRVPVLRFRAGELHVAVAADSIDAIATPPPRPAGDPGDPRHVASLMGEPPQPPATTQRYLRIRHGDAALELVVDGPVTMAAVTLREIVPLKNAIARGGFTLGFALLDREVVALLDVSKLLEAARREAAPTPTEHGPGAPAHPDHRDPRDTP